MKMLIADDNPGILSLLSEFAEAEGFEVFQAADGQEALDVFSSTDLDIILLDVMMPKVDGFEVCRLIRQESMVPIIMITARGEDFEKIMGLDIGADDYIVKPFSAEEVLARVRAILRRLQTSDQDQHQEKQQSLGGLLLNESTFQAHYKEEELRLTKKEFELLWTFMEHPQQVFTRDQLLDRVWGYDFFGDSRTVDTHVKRIRQKLKKLDDYAYGIDTVWGVGYRFIALEEEDK